MQSIDIKVLGGLPITATFEIYGDFINRYLDHWRITHIAGKLCKKKPQWLYNRISNANEIELIETKILESLTD